MMVSSVKKASRPSRTRDEDDDPNDQDRADEDKEIETSDQASTEQPPNQGKLLLDATVADQAIRYPTDVSLLNEAREFSEQIIDSLFKGVEDKQQSKPRTCRQKARREYLSFAKRRKAGMKLTRRAIKQQLQYLRRNLKHIDALLCSYTEGKPLPLPNWLLRRYWVIQHLYQQQKGMYDDRVNRCDNRLACFIHEFRASASSVVYYERTGYCHTL